MNAELFSACLETFLNAERKYQINYHAFELEMPPSDITADHYNMSQHLQAFIYINVTYIIYAAYIVRALTC